MLSITMGVVEAQTGMGPAGGVMLRLCLVLGFMGGVAALAGLVLAGAPLWLAVLGYSLTGSLVTGAAAWLGYRRTLPRRKGRATRPVGAMALQPVRVQG